MGVISNATYLGVLIGFRWMTWPWWLSAGLAYAASMIINYVLQRSLTFRNPAAHRQQGPRYLVVMLSCLLVNSGLMVLLVGTMEAHPALAQTACIAITPSFSYVGQKCWGFRRKAMA